MESPYCPTDQRFLPDRYVEGTCPHCGYTDARGDQCDNCGRTLDPTQLIDAALPHLRQRDAPIEIRETEHFFLDLPQVQEPDCWHWLQTGQRALAPHRASTSRSTGSKRGCGRAPSPATSTGACRCRCRARTTSASTSGSSA